MSSYPAKGRAFFRRLPLAFCLCLCLGAWLAACGYGFNDGAPTVMGTPDKTLKIKGLEQPTLYPWLGQIIRSDLRDEVNARNVAIWVDSGEADYTIQVNVDYFTIRSYIDNRRSETLISNITLRLEAIIYDGKTDTEVWRSGRRSYSDQYETYDERDAAQQLSRQVVHRLVQAMRDNF